VRILEATMERRKEAAAVPAPVAREWRELDKAAKLSEATDRALDNAYSFLCMEVDPVADPKMYALQQSVGLATISNQIRLDSAKLQAQTAVHNLPEDTVRQRFAQLLERLDLEPDDDADDVGELADVGVTVIEC
jgi:hypothetical protein